MAAITVRRNVFLLPIKPRFSLQGLYHKFVENGDAKPQPLTEDDYLIFKPGEIDVSKWKKVDSRSLGITRTMVPVSPYTVMHILRIRGFEAYLVGGCVRDLLLKRTPKDFDVITTANLNEISKQFHRCEVVGYRFPVCRVYVKGSVVEVSSFDTLAKDSEGKENFLISQMPKGGDKLDLIRWKNSMHRDFTINSLFFDPFLHKIYDYNDGMKDLLELKLRTLVPAQLSFTEDSARMLRALRIAARLGLSLSMEIKSAMFKQRSSISQLSQSRITMELNYMLSFGAAESSLSLLHKYHLLEILLPFQAAYISQQATRYGQSSMMLMKLFSHLDKLVTCDRPSGHHLWIGLLGFHLALVNNPQIPFVVLTFASVLYHQSWENGLNFARKYVGKLVSFEPETLESYNFISDNEIAEKVNKLAILVVDSIDVLVDTDSLHKTMAKFTDFPSLDSVFIHQNMGLHTKQLFHVLFHKVETYQKGRTSFKINYDLLKKGDSNETRFVLGKIILNTMGCSVDHAIDPNEVNHQVNYDVPFSPKIKHLVNEKEDIKQSPLPSKLDLQLASAQQKLTKKLSSIMQKNSKQKEYEVDQDYSQKRVSANHKIVVSISSDPEIEAVKTNEPENVMSESQMQELIGMLETLTDNENSPSQLQTQNLEEKTQIKVENDETEFDHLVGSVQTNCNRAIEEAKDSPIEIRKLNQILVSFVDEQVERKKKKVLEESSLESSFIDTSRMENSQNTVEVCVQQPDELKTTQPKKNTGAKLSKSTESSMIGEKKKQRVCSYCKEVGHNKTGCPKRKIEEAACQVHTEST